MTPGHCNSFSIKAQQLSSWVLDVQGNKAPFRHTGSFLAGKIDGEIFHTAAEERRKVLSIPPFTPSKSTTQNSYSERSLHPGSL